jgi:hypothetical protein
MSDKPSYLGLLNAIAVAEGNAECYLDAWASATSRDDVRQVISTIALREGEHSKAFAKRMCELGFEVMAKPAPDLAEKMAVASSTELSDREKFERLDLISTPDTDRPDIFSAMFADSTIDIQTGALLGRYIAEERDSGRMFAACYGQLCADEGRSENDRAEESRSRRSGKKGARIRALEDRMETIEAKLDQVIGLCSAD